MKVYITGIINRMTKSASKPPSKQTSKSAAGGVGGGIKKPPASKPSRNPQFEWWTAHVGSTRDSPPQMDSKGVVAVGYRESSAWDAVGDLALRHLATMDPQKECIVFDIDGTVLFNNLTGKGGAEVFPNMCGIQIAMAASSKGVPIYFVTARMDSEQNRKDTERHLQAVGFIPYKKRKGDRGGIPYMGLIMRPSKKVPSKFPAISQYKKQARMFIMKQSGLRIGQNWGDQYTDHISTNSSKLVEGLIGGYNETYAFWGPVEDEGGYCGKLPGE